MQGQQGTLLTRVLHAVDIRCEEVLDELEEWGKTAVKRANQSLVDQAVALAATTQLQQHTVKLLHRLQQQFSERKSLDGLPLETDDPLPPSFASGLSSEGELLNNGSHPKRQKIGHDAEHLGRLDGLHTRVRDHQQLLDDSRRLLFRGLCSVHSDRGQRAAAVRENEHGSTSQSTRQRMAAFAGAGSFSALILPEDFACNFTETYNVSGFVLLEYLYRQLSLDAGQNMHPEEMKMDEDVLDSIGVSVRDGMYKTLTESSDKIKLWWERSSPPVKTEYAVQQRFSYNEAAFLGDFRDVVRHSGKAMRRQMLPKCTLTNTRRGNGLWLVLTTV